MAGAAPADFLDALTVASDILVRHERGGAFARRVLFVTDLRTPCELDEDFIQGIAAGMRGAAVQLVVAGVVAASFLSKVDDASNVLLAAQVKQPKPTTTFRGALELTPWVSLKVWVYKKVSEQKPPPMKKCNEESGDDPDEIKGERTYTSYANPDEPAEIAPEMMIGAGLRTSYMQSTLRA
jgi:ATP-dependent DNA helicase 2 subunit 2